MHRERCYIKGHVEGRCLAGILPGTADAVADNWSSQVRNS